MKKELGKITHVSFGLGGYQECMLGLSLSFEGKGFGTSTYISGGWYEYPENAKYSREELNKARVDMCDTILSTLKKAKVEDINALKGIPVELTFDSSRLVDWRVLEEVL
jgi:hypothetical protein